MAEPLKVKPHPDYPPEEGRYVRGNDFIERFRRQVSLIDLQFKGTPDTIRKAVWSCYQEQPVEFMGYSLYDTGAYPEAPLSGKITQRVMQPWILPADEKEQAAVQRMQAMVERLRKRNKT